MSYTPEQQQEIQKFNQLRQNLESLTRSKIQMESRVSELKITQEEIKGLDDDMEVYKTVGQLLLKTSMAKAKEDVNTELDELEPKIIGLKSQVEKFEERVREAEKRLRESIQ
ncbi:MAG: prefoldin subunit [Candidatus Kariarchaeaceae archaeon]